MDVELGKPPLAQTTAETGYYDHRHARLNSLHCRGQLVAIFARHGEVGDDKSDSDWRSGLIRQGIRAVLKTAPVAEGWQHGLHHLDDHDLVIDK